MGWGRNMYTNLFKINFKITFVKNVGKIEANLILNFWDRDLLDK